MKIKNIIQISFVILLSAWVASCGKDNYDAPQSTLTGQIVYNGSPVQVRGTSQAVQLQLYQDGYQKRDPISVYVTQDGSFSAKLFDGEYKMVTRDRNGPWENTRDTMLINLKGSKHVELSVKPFFTVSEANITCNTASSTLSASLTITRVVSSAQLEKVYLILSKTQFADEAQNLIRKEVTGVSTGSVSLNSSLTADDVSRINSTPTLFGRVGVKTVGTEQAIWTPVVRLK